MTTLDTLCERFKLEHPGMPVSSLSRVLQNENGKSLQVKTDDVEKYISSIIKSKDEDTREIGEWMQTMTPEEQRKIMNKLRITAATSGLVSLIPEGLRSHVDGMIRAQSAAAAARLVPENPPLQTMRSAVGDAQPPASNPLLPGAATGNGNALNFLDQMMNSGILQQVAEMASEEGEDHEATQEELQTHQSQIDSMRKVILTMQRDMQNIKERMRLLESGGTAGGGGRRKGRKGRGAGS